MNTIKNFRKYLFLIAMIGSLVVFTGCQAEVAAPPAQEGGTISISAIPGVTAPATGETPVSVAMETTQYTGTVTWAPLASTYAASTDYTATVTLTAKAGFTLTSVEADFFAVAGATATNTADSGVVTAVFPETGNTVAPVSRVELGSAGDYVILAEATITTTGSTAITGDLGLSPAATSFYTGFAYTDATGYATSDLVTGNLYASDMAPPTSSELTTAVSNMIAAYDNAAARSTTPDVSGGQTYLNLGAGTIVGETLAPGVYKWTSPVGIGSDLTLNGGATDVWIFQISSTLDVAGGFSVLLTGGALAENVFWQVAEDVTLAPGAHMEGIILGKTKIVLQTGSSINGRLLAQTQVTLDAATVVNP